MQIIVDIISGSWSCPDSDVKDDLKIVQLLQVVSYWRS